jgi:hypothetical protein
MLRLAVSNPTQCCVLARAEHQRIAARTSPHSPVLVCMHYTRNYFAFKSLYERFTLAPSGGRPAPGLAYVARVFCLAAKSQQGNRVQIPNRCNLGILESCPPGHQVSA